MATSKVTKWFHGTTPPIREGWYEFLVQLGWWFKRKKIMAYYRPELMTWHPKKDEPGYAIAAFDWWRGLAKPTRNGATVNGNLRNTRFKAWR